MRNASATENSTMSEIGMATLENEAFGTTATEAVVRDNNETKGANSNHKDQVVQGFKSQQPRDLLNISTFYSNEDDGGGGGGGVGGGGGGVDGGGFDGGGGGSTAINVETSPTSSGYGENDSPTSTEDGFFVVNNNISLYRSVSVSMTSDELYYYDYYYHTQHHPHPYHHHPLLLHDHHDQSTSSDFGGLASSSMVDTAASGVLSTGGLPDVIVEGLEGSGEGRQFWEQCLVSVVLSSIALSAVIGNILIILAVWRYRKLRTVTNCFVVSLASADLLVSVLVLPLNIVVEVTGRWMFSGLLCDLWVSCDVLLCTASILNLCCISLDRYFAITRPLVYTTRRSKRLAIFMVGVAWALAAVVTCPPIFGWKEEGRDLADGCALTRDPGYIIYSACGSFFIPLLVMLFVYARIYHVARKREKRLRPYWRTFFSGRRKRHCDDDSNDNNSDICLSSTVAAFAANPKATATAKATANATAAANAASETQTTNFSFAGCCGSSGALPLIEVSDDDKGATTFTHWFTKRHSTVASSGGGGGYSTSLMTSQVANKLRSSATATDAAEQGSVSTTTSVGTDVACPSSECGCGRGGETTTTTGKRSVSAPWGSSFFYFPLLRRRHRFRFCRRYHKHRRYLRYTVEHHCYGNSHTTASPPASSSAAAAAVPLLDSNANENVGECRAFPETSTLGTASHRCPTTRQQRDNNHETTTTTTITYHKPSGSCPTKANQSNKCPFTKETRAITPVYNPRANNAAYNDHLADSRHHLCSYNGEKEAIARNNHNHTTNWRRCGVHTEGHTGGHTGGHTRGHSWGHTGGHTVGHTGGQTGDHTETLSGDAVTIPTREQAFAHNGGGGGGGEGSRRHLNSSRKYLSVFSSSSSRRLTQFSTNRSITPPAGIISNYNDKSSTDAAAATTAAARSSESYSNTKVSGYSYHYHHQKHQQQHQQQHQYQLRRHFNCRTMSTSGSADAGGDAVGDAGDCSSRSPRRHQQQHKVERSLYMKERKTAKTLAIVVGCFVVCWLPFFLVYVIDVFCPSSRCRVTPTLFSALTWLGYFNSALNPLIYALYNTTFRTAFWNLTFGLCCCRKSKTYHRTTAASYHVTMATENKGK